MTGRPRLILSEEAPPPVEIPLYKECKELSRGWWNGSLQKRALVILHDPTGDFRPGSRWMWSDLLGIERDAWRPTIPALDEWPTGLIVEEARSGHRYVLAETRHFELWSDMQTRNYNSRQKRCEVKP